ncbi:antiviral helicase [Ceraceosorus bombacis]|uniref:Antiviral helicase n=1 Tax=Ceraceosorus bombacis TaxID=401625 RepID=A0A0P1BFZ7_9BASI|nr:antiviral helicase [Ceraceosorus bombacis]
MPAKTVVFTSVRKFDGTENRNLTSGEFIQMSGRAGRRGLDDRGIVIMMFDEKLEPADAKTMVKGEADRLNSAFHLGYNMILNLMRVEGISPEYMLERCFFQFQSAASVPELEGKLASQRKELEQAVVPDEEQTEEYFALKHQLQELQSDVREVVTHPTYALPFLQPGRLAHVQHEDLDFGWGIVIRYQKRITPSRGGKVDASASERPQSQWIVDVLLDCEAGSTAPTIKDVATRAQKQVKGADTAPLGLRPCPSGKRGEMLAVPVLLSTISRISGVRLKMSPDLRSREARDQARTNLLEVKRRFAGSDSRGKGVPVLDPVKDMKIADQSFATLLSKIRLVESRLSESKVAALSGKERGQLQEAYEHKQELERGVKSLERQLSDAHSVLQLDELKCRKRVLRRLGFTTDDDVVQKKGRVACEISTGDELLLTEMIFNNVFNDLDPNQCAALLSCFVFDEKSEQQTRLKEDLAGPLRVMQETARRIAKVSIESRLQVNEDEYVASFKVELMEAVLQWCRGAKFSEICKMTDVFEGSLIRVFRRLQELLRQVVQASKAIGNVELQEKFEASQKALERENSIIFSPSLYL